MKKLILVTGGAGFIGSNFTRMAVGRGYRVVNLDKLTYAGTRESLRGVDSGLHVFVKGDINDRELVLQLLRKHAICAIVNFAAESHVDRSIDSPGEFIRTNINGTFELLEAARTFWQELEPESRNEFRFLHVSTDEVFGSIESGLFTESSPAAPNSPYAASKAAADHLVRAYHHTYGLPTLVTNCSNNYGPYQFPEKLIPNTLLSALQGRMLPVYGDGSNVRDWLYVEDHCEAIIRVLERGRTGSAYNVGGESERKNIDLVRSICALLDKERPRADGRSYVEQIAFVPDRPGHDRRYAIDITRIRRELDWKPSISLDEGLARTLRWYLDNEDWWVPLVRERYQGQRLGLAVESRDGRRQ
ncbi:MAG TPA: dTDP-glucose 4,6-dehydratase [Gammaproteobacteria bacterium]